MAGLALTTERRDELATLLNDERLLEPKYPKVADYLDTAMPLSGSGDDQADVPFASPNNRRGIRESLSDVTEVLLSGHHGVPNRSQVRAAMLWACFARLQNTDAEPPASLASAIAWLTDTPSS